MEKLLKKLDKRFFKCSRGVAINVEKVESYNFKENTAKLKNKEEFKDVSREKRREMFNRVRGLK